MGGDGGVIANQRKYLRSCGDLNEKEETNKISQDSLKEKSKFCALSSSELQEPIVCCKLGYIYNKEAILTALLDRTLIPKEFTHIKGLKDVREVLFTLNTNENKSSKYMCPITRIEFNGLQQFIAIWSTGFVMSEKALKEMGINNLQAEFGPFTTIDIVKLLPNEEELSFARINLEEHKKKKLSKKRPLDTLAPIVDSNNDNANVERPHQILKNQKLSRAGTIASTVSQNYEQLTQNNKLYKSLFHKDNEEDKTDRDLFMSVAGIRYTLR